MALTIACPVIPLTSLNTLASWIFRLRKKKKGNAPQFDLRAELFRVTGTDLTHDPSQAAQIIVRLFSVRFDLRNVAMAIPAYLAFDFGTNEMNF